ncbi:hypothetical protein SK128_015702, partial [Halocaridina rubra]
SGGNEMQSLGWYVALEEVVPKDEGALFIKKHQKLELLEKTNEHWWYARISRDGKQVTGYVPPEIIIPAEGLFSEE